MVHPAPLITNAPTVKRESRYGSGSPLGHEAETATAAVVPEAVAEAAIAVDQ
jgi:hypothetical protein